MVQFNAGKASVALGTRVKGGRGTLTNILF